jgi:hypothetical protein
MVRHHQSRGLNAAKRLQLIELHNQKAGEIVRQIVVPMLSQGGDFVQVMVLLESVIAGVIMIGVKVTGDKIAVESLVNGVNARLAELRLHAVEPEGRG